MRLLVNTEYRTNDAEIMDDFSIEGIVLHDTLDKLATINQWLGGNRVTLEGLKILLKGQFKDKTITIIDLGCGGGDILREIAVFGQKEGYNFELIGIDANQHATKYATERSSNYKNIKFLHCDVFSDEFKALKFDIAITTLFLHHFNEEQLLGLMNHLLERSKIGVAVNDLHRHRLAYYLFKLITVPIKNRMIIEDGLTSVLRGFKKREILLLSKQLSANYLLKWKWAFRYQWILKR